MQTDNAWLAANWSAAPDILAGTTTRFGGVSQAEFASNNMGLKVGDTPALVARNREGLRQHLARQTNTDVESGLQLQWLEQVHGNECVYIDQVTSIAPYADSLWTDQPNTALVIQSADCVPIALADDRSEVIAAAHGGWRGLVDNVLGVLIQALPVAPDNVHAWIGPCIGPAHFEVGEDVWQPILALYPDAVIEHPQHAAKRFVDLRLVAKRQLQASGVRMISSSGHCTYAGDQWYSHRQVTHALGPTGQTGRLATAVCRMSQTP